MDPSPEFLNVDLEIESTSSLRSLEAELGERVSIMFSGRMKGRHWLCVEITARYKTLDGTIHGLCALIEGLSPKSKRLWDAARRKAFDIGFETRFSSHRANRFSVRATTLSRVGKLGAILAVTLYRQRKADCLRLPRQKNKPERWAARWTQQPP